MAGLTERTVLSLLSSRNNRVKSRRHKAPTSIGIGAYLRLMTIPFLLYVARCKHIVHDFVEVLDEFNVRYFVSDADKQKGRWSKFSTTFSLSVIFVYQVGSSPSGAAGYRLYSATRRRVGRCCRASVWAQHKSLGC